MTGATRHVALIVLAGRVVAVPHLSTAQPYIYPDHGQSYQQQESDKGQYYGCAVQQTGFDPAIPR